MFGISRRGIAAASTIGALSLASASQAVTLLPGEYILGNHPSFFERPPAAGLALTELFDVTAGSDLFTFDFEHESSDMRLIYDDDTDTIRIFGTAFGGRDIGSEYADDEYKGVYSIDFLYDVGVKFANNGADDDLIAAPPASGANTGVIATPIIENDEQVVIGLQDKLRNVGDWSFRFGDELDDNGHLGYEGVSGWGWLRSDRTDMSTQEFSDWQFIATELPVPAPGATALAAAGLIFAGTRRR